MCSEPEEDQRLAGLKVLRGVETFSSSVVRERPGRRRGREVELGVKISEGFW